MKRIFLLGLIFLIGGFVLQASAAIPELISFQGKVDWPGMTSATAISARFEIYTQPTGGIKLWDETHALGTFGDIINNNYMINVTLGSNTPFTIDFKSDYYLQVVLINKTNEHNLTPRQPLTTAPYAMTAKNVQSPLNLLDNLASNNATAPVAVIKAINLGTANQAGCVGVYGISGSTSGSGLRGESKNIGVIGFKAEPSAEDRVDAPAVYGLNQLLQPTGRDPTTWQNAGVKGESDTGYGVVGAGGLGAADFTGNVNVHNGNLNMGIGTDINMLGGNINLVGGGEIKINGVPTTIKAPLYLSSNTYGVVATCENASYYDNYSRQLSGVFGEGGFAGVMGKSFQHGLYGEGGNRAGVYGTASTSFGGEFITQTGNAGLKATHGTANSTAAIFDGNVNIENGNLTVGSTTINDGSITIGNTTITESGVPIPLYMTAKLPSQPTFIATNEGTDYAGVFASKGAYALKVENIGTTGDLNGLEVRAKADGEGIQAYAENGAAVYGSSSNPSGLGNNNVGRGGIEGINTSTGPGVYGTSTGIGGYFTSSGAGPALKAVKGASGNAAEFDGPVICTDLTVSGHIRKDNSTYYASLSPADVLPAIKYGAPDLMDISSSALIIEDSPSSMYAHPAAINISSKGFIPIRLPDGARINRVTIYGQRPASEDSLRADLYSIRFSDGLKTSLGSATFTTGATSASIVPSLAPELDNQNYSYVLNITIKSTQSTTWARFNGSKIQYSTDYIGPIPVIP